MAKVTDRIGRLKLFEKYFDCIEVERIAVHYKHLELRACMLQIDNDSLETVPVIIHDLSTIIKHY